MIPRRDYSHFPDDLMPLGYLLAPLACFDPCVLSSFAELNLFFHFLPQVCPNSVIIPDHLPSVPVLSFCLGYILCLFMTPFSQGRRVLRLSPSKGSRLTP